MDMKTPEIDHKEKVALPDSIVSLIGDIVKDIDQVKSVVDDVHAGSYSKAVGDLLVVVQNIVTDFILPKVVKESEAHTDHGDEKPAS